MKILILVLGTIYDMTNMGEDFDNMEDYYGNRNNKRTL